MDAIVEISLPNLLKTFSIKRMVNIAIMIFVMSSHFDLSNDRQNLKDHFNN